MTRRQSLTLDQGVLVSSDVITASSVICIHQCIHSYPHQHLTAVICTYQWIFLPSSASSAVLTSAYKLVRIRIPLPVLPAAELDLRLAQPVTSKYGAGAPQLVPSRAGQTNALFVHGPPDLPRGNRGWGTVNF